MLKLKKEQNDEIQTMTTIINNGEILAVLVEEIGEIGRALQGEGDLTEELIQAAAVCIRWLEYKDPAE
jgi:NTP pyrophosphatase (non-canonical NTP hydrolase)